MSSRRSYWPAAGFVGAATALTVLQLGALLNSRKPSVVQAVENRFIDGFAASLKEVAVQLFGRHDKVALEIGTAIVCLAAGAAIGNWARGRLWALATGFGVFAALGIWSAAVDPLASGALAAVLVPVAAAAGTAAAFLLGRRWQAGPVGDRESDGFEPNDLDDERVTTGVTRRTVLVEGGIAAAALLVLSTVARSVRNTADDVVAAVRQKLPAPKQTTALPDQPFDVSGVSAYITPTKEFYRIDTALDVPSVDVASWKLRITGMVDHPLELTYDELLARDLVEVPVTLQCVSNEVGGDLVGTAMWTGVRLADVLNEAGVQHRADQVVGESVDGFTAGFPSSVALDGRDALIAVGMGGETLPPLHGFPARLVVPGLYGYVSATKWLSEIRLTTFAEEAGYWIPRGWSRLGPIKTQSRIDVPRDGGSIGRGKVAIAGVAWAPTRKISRVEVRVDDGPWQDATLGRVANDDTWVQWMLPWDAASGNHHAEVRATDGTGDVQTAELADPAPNGATGHHRVEFTVEG